jgi:hypothetical protein
MCKRAAACALEIRKEALKFLPEQTLKPQD